MINRLIEPTSGSLVDAKNVLEQDPVALRRGIGYVIQTIGLLPHRTVRENMGTAPKPSGGRGGAGLRLLDAPAPDGGRTDLDGEGRGLGAGGDQLRGALPRTTGSGWTRTSAPTSRP
jgi:hypothetical protein